jgi:hypothetical protein
MSTPLKPKKLKKADENKPFHYAGAADKANQDNEGVLQDAYGQISNVTSDGQAPADPKKALDNQNFKNKQSGQTHRESINKLMGAVEANRDTHLASGSHHIDYRNEPAAGTPVADGPEDDPDTDWVDPERAYWHGIDNEVNEVDPQNGQPMPDNWDGKKEIISWQKKPLIVPSVQNNRYLTTTTSGQLDPNNSRDFGDLPLRLGPKAAGQLSRNLYSFIPEEGKLGAEKFHQYNSGYSRNGAETPHNWEHNRLSSIIDYLKMPEEEQSEFHNQMGHTPEQAAKFDGDMENAFRHLQYASNKATNSWINRDIDSIKKHEVEQLMKWEPTPEDQKRAFVMGVNSIVLTPEYNAARFMAEGYDPNEDDIINATQDYEGDYAAVALACYRIPVNSENRSILDKFLMIQEFGKFEFDVAIMPRMVKPVFKEYAKIAKKIQEGYKDNKIHAVELNGKHCKGAALFKDLSTDTVWFIKPGNGKPSKAWGVQEEKTSASRREVAFNEAAKIFGLERYVPESALVTLDGEEVAILQFFDKEFKSVEDVKKSKELNLQQEFSKFVNNGLLYKWAILDYVLGNPDRHGGNIMIDKFGNLRLIDAGSAFAGPSFNPGKDPRSWVPFYLRVFSGRKWKELTPESKMDVLPRLSHGVEDALAHWVYLISVHKLTELLNKFGINPTPTIDRLMELKNYFGPKSEFIRKFYSNLIHQEAQEKQEAPEGAEQ